MFQGVIIDNYGNGDLVRIQILVVPTIGRNLCSVETATRNGIVSIFDRENPRLEAFSVTLPLCGEQDDLYSFVLDLSADAYGATELAMNAVSNARFGTGGWPTSTEGPWNSCSGTTQRDHLRPHHSGLRRLRCGKRPTANSSEESSTCRHHPGFPALLRRSHEPFHPRDLRGFQIRQQAHRPVHQVDRRLLVGEQELHFRLLSPVRRINYHPLRRPSHLLACRQRREIHERSVHLRRPSQSLACQQRRAIHERSV